MNLRKIVVMLLFIVGAGVACAEDGLTVKDVAIPKDGKAMLAIETAFESDAYFGYQLEVVLPKGVSISLDKNGRPSAESYTELDIVGSIISSTSESTTYQFVASKMGNPHIPAGSYVLVVVPVETDGTLSVGDALDGSIRNILFSDGTQKGMGMADVKFTITIDEPDDGRLKFNESSAILPKYTAGQKADVTMLRTIKANQWNTIVLPFTLTKAKAEAAFGSDVQLAEFTGFETIYASEDDMTPDAININLSTYTMTAKKGMTGGKPFVIKTSKDIESFQADNVTLAEEVNDVEEYDDEYGTPGRFTGTFVKTTIPEDGLFISDNKFWYSAGKSTAKAFRCWFELGAVLDKETNFEARVIFKFDDETSGIATVKRTEDESFFDLMGRKLLKANKKGVYVKNGRKVVVK